VFLNLALYVLIVIASCGSQQRKFPSGTDTIMMAVIRALTQYEIVSALASALRLADARHIRFDLPSSISKCC
jgi:hypothetical protein